jgi:hypothetical protein
LSGRGGLTVADVAVGVFTSALNLRERALSVQNTWLMRFPKGYLLGGWKDDPGLKMISLGEDVGEDYHSAHRKQFLGLLELRRRCPDAKWFFLTGCDAFIFADSLVELLSDYDSRRELLIGGHCGEATVRGERLIFPSGGPGFALSAALVDALGDAIPGFVGEWEGGSLGPPEACDLAMAYLAMRERGVRVTFREGFYFLQPYKYPGTMFKDGEGRDIDRAPITRPIAFHSLSIREMYLLASGRTPRRPGAAWFAFDLAAKVVTRKLRTRSIVNRVCRPLFGRRALIKEQR